MWRCQSILPPVGFVSKVESLWASVTCLQVNVNKDTVVLLMERDDFWLWESREVVMSMTPRSYADLHGVFLYNGTMILIVFCLLFDL